MTKLTKGYSLRLTLFLVVFVVSACRSSPAHVVSDEAAHQVRRDEDVRIERVDAGLTLAGTLSLPAGEGPHPAVLFLTGSGGHTRDQVISGLPMFRVIGDALVDRGIGVLRVDDRGVGVSTGPGVRASTTLDRSEDASAALRYLASRPEINADQIGVLGHSEGTLTLSPVSKGGMRSSGSAAVIL